MRVCEFCDRRHSPPGGVRRGGHFFLVGRLSECEASGLVLYIEIHLWLETEWSLRDCCGIVRLSNVNRASEH
jgi:hypothetical protein